MEALYIAYLAACVYVCLPFIYWMTAPDWRKTIAGRSLMMLLSALALAFAIITTSGIFGAYPGREAVRYIIYTATLLAGVRLAVLFMQLRFGPKQGRWVDNS